MLVPIAFALLLMNLLTAFAFANDKGRAIRGERRIPEATLLRLALFGGSLGAVWARSRFRHKTCKQPFSGRLDLIAMLHAGLVAGLAATLLL